jgi:CheY-like chemotaxis protein
LLRTVQLVGGARKTLRLLSADDVPEVGWLLEALLANSRCTVEFVPDGAAAVAGARSGAFDVILLDLDMPVMDGLEAARAIRADEKRDGRAPVPILVDSGQDLEHDLGDDDVQRSESSGEADPEIAALIPEFLANRQADVEKLRGFIESADWAAVKAIGHKMKGTGRGDGFPRISEIGRSLEGAAADGHAGRIRAATDALEAYLERVRAV